MVIKEGVMKKKDKSWKSDGDVYVGHLVGDNTIYVGGRYYQNTAQIHLSLGEAKWLRKHLLEAIKRVKK